MINLETYVKYQKNADLFSEHIAEIREFNKTLIEKYPWLRIKHYSDFDLYPEDAITGEEEYNFTWFDAIDPGWQLAFGLQMCDEIQRELERVNYVDQYSISEIKEKFGVLDWFSGGVPANSNLHEIEEKYEDLSKNYCRHCGKPNKWVLDDPYWIYYYCDDCKNKLEKRAGEHYKFREMK